MSDDIMARVGAAMRLDRAEARDALAALWDETEDPLPRCAIAHHAADRQDDAEAELAWDERALEAAAGLPAEQRDSFLPSLHLNLGDVHRRLHHVEAAREHLAAARANAHHLAQDEYGAMIRGGIENLARKLAGTTDA
ncbi:hypothetical protein ACQP1P_34295 [Dactylosporangium sp. CA-052675]|uniref:hypothetical protein n=1 Tax=Dactylosporangium sp. CA-052675 TaxID=3239927 RepID=UPI003D8D8691